MEERGVGVSSGKIMKTSLSRRYKVCSLFSGAGGLDEGFRMAGGFTTVFANDLKRAPAASFSSNFKFKTVTPQYMANGRNFIRKFVCGGIEDVEFRVFPPEFADVVAGGPPCQDFSIVRGPPSERRGIETKRGRLYSYYVKALAYIQPKFFVFENVPGLISSNKGEAYKKILSDLSELEKAWPEIEADIGNGDLSNIAGYDILFQGIVDSSKLGVPQRRKRLIVLGVRKGEIAEENIGSASKIARYILEGKDSLISKYPLTPIEAFEGQDLSELSERYTEIMSEYKGLWRELRSEKSIEWEEANVDKLPKDAIKDYLILNGITPFGPDEVRKAMSEHRRILRKLGWLGRPVKEESYADGSNLLPKESEEVRRRLMQIPPGENIDFLEGSRYYVRSNGMSLIYRRIHPLVPSPTIVAFGGGGTWGYHYERGRTALTNRERARLQSFPDKFLFSGSVSEVRAQIGEAVPPLVGFAVAKAIRMISDSFLNEGLSRAPLPIEDQQARELR
ncbi:MAG: DNA cytosine methyltransferase [Candidatus Micrarchaeaceae archaeon]